MILTDTFIVERAELITENRGGKQTPILRGVFGRCEEKNNNGRVYSKPILEREVKRIADAMTERRLLGELDHPTHDAVKLSNVSHLITNLDFQNNELIGECELLDTPAGKVAQALIEGGVKVGISSRGMGTLSEDADGTKRVNEDFRLVTFDLVADPSTRGAFPGLSESCQSTLVEEIVKDTLHKAAKEKVFTTLLKDKLRERSAEFGTQDANWAKEAPASIQDKEAKKAKNKKKPTAEDPFRNWEDFYGYNTGKPRLVKTRGYEDFDTVTEPAEVTESFGNQYATLKQLISERYQLTETSNKYAELKGILLENLQEAVPFRKRVQRLGGRLSDRGTRLMRRAELQQKRSDVFKRKHGTPSAPSDQNLTSPGVKTALGKGLRAVGKKLSGPEPRVPLSQRSPEERKAVLDRAKKKLASYRAAEAGVKAARKPYQKITGPGMRSEKPAEKPAAAKTSTPRRKVKPDDTIQAPKSAQPFGAGATKPVKRLSRKGQPFGAGL